MRRRAVSSGNALFANVSVLVYRDRRVNIFVLCSVGVVKHYNHLFGKKQLVALFSLVPVFLLVSFLMAMFFDGGIFFSLQL